jgi:hypothetical protein
MSGNYTMEFQLAPTMCNWPVLTHRWPVTVVPIDEGNTFGYYSYFADIVLVNNGFTFKWRAIYGYDAVHQIGTNGFDVNVGTGSRDCGQVTSDAGYRMCFQAGISGKPPMTHVGSRPDFSAPINDINTVYSWYNAPASFHPTTSSSLSPLTWGHNEIYGDYWCGAGGPAPYGKFTLTPR